VGRFRQQIFVQQPQNPVNFNGGPLPIRRGKSEERQRMNPEPGRNFDNAPGCFRSRTMTGGTRQTARGGPAAVSVRDDGNVEPGSVRNGRSHDGNFSNWELMHLHVLSPPWSKYCKLLYIAK
jgi:hypothetical protein